MMIYDRGYMPTELRHKIRERDNFTCQHCGKKAPNVEIQIDHKIPVTKGGTDDEINLQILCVDCNLEKGDKILPRYKYLIPMLSNQSGFTSELIEIENNNENEVKTPVKNVEVQVIINYIYEKINHKIELNSAQIKHVIDLCYEFSENEIKYGIDTAAEEYLIIENGEYTIESINNFFSKIKGIIVFTNKPVLRNIAYLKGVCKRRFKMDWKELEGVTLLNNFANLLRKNKIEELLIAQIIEDEITSKVKKMNFYNEFKMLINNKIFQLNSNPLIYNDI